MWRIAFFLTILTASSLHGQIIFSSGFENWADGLPEGFGGPHTTFAADSIQEVSTPVHGGTKAMRLGIATAGPWQITTAPKAVEAHALYTVGCWVRGRASFAITLFDGRPENNGYAPVGSFTQVNDTVNWQFIQRQIYATQNTSGAEFVLRCVNTSPGSHLIVDDLTIQRTLANAQPVSIAGIQESFWPDGSSPYNFQLVRTQGVVTGRAADLFYIQDGSGPWSGIQVLASPPPTLLLGDSVTIFATVAEHAGPEGTWPGTVTQLIVVQALVDHGVALQQPAPVVVTASEAHWEEWEGVLVTVQDLGCTGPPDPITFEWPGANWQGMLDVVALFHTYLAEVGSYHTITGVVHYQGEGKLAPRSENDFSPGVGVAEQAALVAQLFPNPASTQVQIHLSATVTEARYMVLDLHGRKVMEGQLLGDRLILDVQALSPGPYLFRLIKGDEFLNRHFIVE